MNTWTLTSDRNWVIGNDESQLSVFDPRAGKRLKPFAGHVEQVRDIVLSQDQKLVFSASFDGTIRVTPLATLFAEQPNRDVSPMVWIADHGEWLAYTTDGYFDASRRGGSLAAAVSGFDGFRIDQLAVRNNRPDITLGRVGLGTPEALSLFASRHQQRLRRLHFTESELTSDLLSAPHAKIEALTYSGRVAHLKCTFQGNGRSLKRYYVFVNDVVVGDGSGVLLSGTQATADIDVELSAGRNTIEVSTQNDRGIESLRDVRTVNDDTPVRGNLYYLGFGVSRYADPRLTLRFADKDALDLRDAMQQMAGRGFDQVFTRALTNSAVTKAAMERAREFLMPAKVDDTVVVFVAGHGVFRNGPDEQYYFATYDTDIARIHETAAGFSLIEDLVSGIAPRRKLLLLDTCQSGERDSEEREVLVQAGNSRGLVARTIRGLVLDPGAPATRRPKFTPDQDRYIFNDLSRRSGTIVFSAAHGYELSYEDDRLRNGTFTYEVVRALTQSNADANSDGSVSTDELRKYVTRAVSTRTSGLQNPTVDRDNLEALFGFPLARPTPSRVRPR